MKEILALKGISKTYPNNVKANDDISLSVTKGEIHAILGENGAGKSTLMKIIYGLEIPDSGSIYIDGKKTVLSEPLDAINLGIGMVHQHFMLIPSLTVAENIALGHEPANKGVLDKKQMIEKVHELSQQFGFEVDPLETVENLSVAAKQKVDILKALSRGIRILILDEPTAVLAPQEVDELFHELKVLQESGITILFISHKLDEIKKICDRMTVLRKGKSLGTYNVKDISEQEISNIIFGSKTEAISAKKPDTINENILSVEHLTVKAENKNIVDDINVELNSGKILGVVGVEGNGQKEFVECLLGVQKKYSGTIKFLGKDIKENNIRQNRDMGLAYIPEDRIETGLAIDATIADNLSIIHINNHLYTRRILLDKDKINLHAQELVKAYDVVAKSVNQPASSLSGGNMQKIVVARELDNDNALIIAEQPTRGIDLHSAQFIRNKLLEMRNNGKSVLLISADLKEILDLSDEIIVFYNGKISARLENSEDINAETLGFYMLGGHHAK